MVELVGLAPGDAKGIPFDLAMCHIDVLHPPPGRPGHVPLRRGGRMPIRTWGEGGPPVVVIPDFFGPSPFYAALAARLAAAGFLTLLSDPYHDLAQVDLGDGAAALTRLAQRRDEDATEDLAAVVEDARTRTGADRCGVIGFCAGGTWAMSLAERSDVAAVAFYGFPAGLPVEGSRAVPEERLQLLRSPVLAVWGDEDTSVGRDVIERYATASRQASAPVRTVIHPGVGHGFLGGLEDPRRPDAPAAQEAWTEALAFLRQHIRTAGTG